MPGTVPVSLRSEPLSQTLTDKAEGKASFGLADELSSALLGRLKESFSGEQFSLRIIPSFDNLGAVAQVRVLGISQLSRIRTEQDGLPLTEESLKTQFFLPAILKGRAGCRPQELQLNLAIGDEVFRAVLTLFVGIRRVA